MTDENDRIGPLLAALRYKPFRIIALHAALALEAAWQVRSLRALRGWTRRELARRAGLSVTTIVAVEIAAPYWSLKTMCKIGAAFDMAFLCRFTSWGEWVTQTPLTVEHIKQWHREHPNVEP